MANKFETEWTKEQETWRKQQEGRPKKVNAEGKEEDEQRVIDGAILRSCLWRLFKKEVLPLAFLQILSSFNGIGYALGLFALQLLGSLISNHFQQAISIKSMAIKSMMTTGIYRKALRLSPQSRNKFSSGQITNMASSDVMRIQMFMMQMIFIFTIPLQLIVNIVFLISAIGWAAVIGLSLLLVAMPLQAWLFEKMKVIRQKQAPITDQRVKKTTEILNGIRVIKLFAWENSFLNVVESIRKEELVQVLTRSVYQAVVMTQGMTIPALCTCLLLSSMASKVFSSMAWFNQLRMPLWMLPNILNSWAEFNVALTRIESLLLANEIDEEYAIALSPDSKNAIEIVDAEFNWTGPIYPKNTLPPAPPAPKKGAKKSDPKAVSPGGKPTAASGPPPAIAPGPKESLLKNINLTIPKGSLTAIVGSVGSGKSSLLNAIIGEMRKVSGSVAISESVAYAAQSAWIQNATVKDNILFGTEYNKERYLQVLYDAALLPDLRILKDSDQTSIGERGINLSGGQKQRINMARLMYNQASTVLLDDPLSAVDAHVGRHLFEKCILGSMKSRTRILVTHQLHYLSQCDYIVFMKEGSIAEQGRFSDLMANGNAFAEMMKTYGGAADDESSSSGPATTVSEDLTKVFKELEELTTPKDNASNIMSKEDQASGGVAAQVWWRYILSCGGVFFCVQAVTLIAINEGTTVINNLWLTWWTGNDFPWLTTAQYSLIYLALAILSSLATFGYAYFFAFTGTRASRIMHEKALQRILSCPVYFFDTTPVGRIINRFSSDVDQLDNSVAMNVRQLASTASTALSTFIVMIVTLPILVAVLVPCMGIYWFVQDVYRKTAREIKRLSSTARSPWFNNFGESIVGISTIRAYGDQKRFIERNDTAMDVSNSPNFYLTTGGSWLSIRLQLIGSALVLVLSATLFGLCLTYSLTITQTLSMMVQQFTACELAMNSAERVEHYAYRVEVENDGQHKPPSNWPEKGTIEFKEVTMRYAPHLPVVLDTVSFDIRNKEKVGIVGRTGSGKSSLTQAIFRIATTEGLIKIDGIDINSVSLKDLRLISPSFLSGTFRFNMDPVGEYSDADLWNALDRAGMKKKVNSLEGKLDATVQANGDNLSVGERQLLCLARAMLKKPKVLIMDEATANVDYETDAAIGKALREDFQDSTVLTIAHRLNTVMDYDRILVLDAGKVAEFDSPRNLVANEDTIFYNLVAQTGESNAAVLKKMVI
ncbi:hypothetical protein BCR33DRAFT_753523 [Rhizoclosmatium globosum]|uniref:P-loop containing nucleoside triphosphate hydrolase protein n=1 Tax=Rhizoclosmatium globosum TaxID=329046 RepID=A0A1Y2CHQ0_9FUNG|nr:hypothetical protein BCR33DRAFT_753523 [Rhizoclosmatium globosum]|eukprot:ORY46466.1 hypothetical protein BCR33DRAFT_753523 [Rhizoclosmatium globosum]